MAELFSDFFQSVYTSNEFITESLPENRDFISDNLCQIDFLHEDIYVILSETDYSKSCGADKISGIILKECAEELAYTLALIFNKSIATGKFPAHFKSANV